jgi:DNA (cytosine-5)-methyltransferase 1
MGFDARWGVLGAADVGAPHQRDRIWIVATNTRHGEQRQQESFVRQKFSKSIGSVISDLCKDLAYTDRIWIVGKATNSTSLRLHNEENQRVLESQRWGELQSEQSRDSSEMAHTDGMRQLQPQGSESEQRGRVGDSGEQVAHTDGTQLKGDKRTERGSAERTDIGKPSWWATEPNVGRVANGVAARVDRLKAIGNGQVSLCAATAWKLLTGGMK